MSVLDDAQDAAEPTGDAGQDSAADDGARDAQTEFGSALREAREKAGLSLADIADALKVTQRTVVALEAERYEELPPRPYIRGYVQRYARVVGLDAAAVTVASDSVEAEPVLPAVVPRSRWTSFNDFARDSWGLVYGSIVLVFVILIGGALWWAWRGGNAEQAVPEVAPRTAASNSVPVTAASPPTPRVDTEVVSPLPAAPDQAPDSIAAVPAAPDQAPDSIAPLPAAPDQAPDSIAAVPAAPDQALDSTTTAAEPPEPLVADPAPPEATPVEPGVAEADSDEAATERLARPDLITFVFEGECWVEVRGRGGELVHGDLGRDGETVTVSGRAPFSVLLGNPNVVDVTFNGEPVSVDPGRPGAVARFQVGADDSGSGTGEVVGNGG